MTYLFYIHLRSLLVVAISFTVAEVLRCPGYIITHIQLTYTLGLHCRHLNIFSLCFYIVILLYVPYLNQLADRNVLSSPCISITTEIHYESIIREVNVLIYGDCSAVVKITVATDIIVV